MTIWQQHKTTRTVTQDLALAAYSIEIRLVAYPSTLHDDSSLPQRILYCCCMSGRRRRSLPMQILLEQRPERQFDSSSHALPISSCLAHWLREQLPEAHCTKALLYPADSDLHVTGVWRQDVTGRRSQCMSIRRWGTISS